jgi:ubiquitin carboxyl-terminal hydrolase 4/11
MLSDASSSSNKRSVAEGATVENRSPRADEMSTLSLSDPNQDIDAYMAEQGDGDMSDVISQPQPDAQHAEPSLLKLTAIEGLKNTSMVVGDTWYLVARQWYKRWRKACTGEVDKEGRVDEKDLGPVDNSSLVDKDGNLISTTVEGVDVEFMSAAAWRLFVSWSVHFSSVQLFAIF